MYKVLESFKDRDGKIYNVGDEYVNYDKEAIKRLSTKENKYERAFIKKEVKRQSKKKVVEDGE